MSNVGIHSRRDFLNLATAGAAGAAILAPAAAADARAQATIAAIAFDGFAIIDARPVAARVEEMFPGKGKSLMTAWRTQQFGYAWLRTMGRQYVDFWKITEDALETSAAALNLELGGGRADRIMQAYLELTAWPDAVPVLRRLKSAGMKLVFLSNFTAPMLEAAVRNAGLEGLFEEHLSTDRVQAYKPDPRAYAMAPDTLKLTRDQIAFVAFAGWDVAGAKWFGYRTYWANRIGALADNLGVTADAARPDLSDLESFVGV